MSRNSRPLTITFTGRDAAIIRESIVYWAKWDAYDDPECEETLKNGVMEMVCKWAYVEGIARDVAEKAGYSGDEER